MFLLFADAASTIKRSRYIGLQTERDRKYESIVDVDKRPSDAIGSATRVDDRVTLYNHSILYSILFKRL